MQDEAEARMGGIKLSKMASGSNQVTSNNGPTAKKCFEDPELMADVFKLPVWMIRGIKNHIRALTCMEEIDSEVFYAEAQEWLDKFHGSPWSWNTLTPTLHVLFWHAHKMIELFPVPIGLLSEEGSEGTNKVFRIDRLHHTRQTGGKRGVEIQLMDIMKRSHQRANLKILRLTPVRERPVSSLEDIAHFIAKPRPPLHPASKSSFWNFSVSRTLPVTMGPPSKVRGGGDSGKSPLGILLP